MTDELKLTNLSKDVNVREYETEEFTTFMANVSHVFREKDKLIVESVNNAARYKEALENIGNNIFDSGQDSGQYMAEVARNALNIKED